MSKYDWSEIGQKAPPYMIRMGYFCTVSKKLYGDDCFNFEKKFQSWSKFCLTK